MDCKKSKFIENIIIFGITLILLFTQNFINSQIISDRCVNIVLKGFKYQNAIQELKSNSTIMNNILKYNEKILSLKNESFSGLEYLKDKEYVLDIVELFLSKNDDINDSFWDAMMESYPPTWHVYGLRPTQISIIKTRFMESCSANIISLFKEGIVVKYHTLVPTLKDMTILTMGKINKICMKIRNKMIEQGFELYDGPLSFTRSQLLSFNRCSNKYNDDLADLILLTMDDKYNIDLNKFRVCLIVEDISRDPKLFKETCIESMKSHLLDLLPSNLNVWDETIYLCQLIGNIKQLTNIFDETPQLTNFNLLENSPENNLKNFLLSYVKLGYNFSLNEIGKKIVSSTYIKERRFLESCINFFETLIMSKGVEILIPTSDFNISWNDNFKLMYEKTIFQLRSKFLITCSSIYMHLLKNKPKKTSVSKIKGSKVFTRSDLSVLLESNTLIYDSCDNKYIFIKDKELTQDILAEMIIAAISYSPQKSLSSIALNNGIIKKPICKLSGSLLKFLTENINILEKSSFVSKCVKLIFKIASIEKKELEIKRSISELCSTIWFSIQKFLE